MVIPPCVIFKHLREPSFSRKLPQNEKSFEMNFQNSKKYILLAFANKITQVSYNLS